MPGEFGFELLHALPFLHWLHRCGLLGSTSACGGMEPFYAFSPRHAPRQCAARRARSHWRPGTLAAATPDGWTWCGLGRERRLMSGAVRYYAYPSDRWAPPPLHATYRALPPPLAAALRPRAPRLVWLQNKFYPFAGRDVAENFLSLRMLRTVLDTLLGCGFQVVYNHPALSDVGTPDADDAAGLTNQTNGSGGDRDSGGDGGGGGLGDLAMLRGPRYAAARRARRLLLLPEVAAAAQLPYNEVQLRVAAQSRCFIAPQGGASVLTFYQPGLHVVSDCTGKERCRASESSGGGDYFHYFTLLPAAAGESIIYNVLQDERRLAAALDLMCSTDVCSTAGE